MRVYATVRTAASHTRNVFYGAEPITSFTFAVSNGQFDVLKSHIALCRCCNVGEICREPARHRRRAQLQDRLDPARGRRHRRGRRRCRRTDQGDRRQVRPVREQRGGFRLKARPVIVLRYGAPLYRDDTNLTELRQWGRETL